MSTFETFARYYDLFYRDKDYAAEAAFVGALLARHAPRARTLLELGCGTARHASHWVGSGFEVTGVDRSAQMLEEARRTLSTLPQEVRSRLRLVEGDVTDLNPEVGQFDAVLSLFHVVNYQITNAGLRGMFAGARRALRAGGVFAFDFWYGPAVLSDRPAVRVREMRGDAGETVLRIAQPELDVNHNRVTVNYRLIVIRDGQPAQEHRESHRMRYLFMPEIQLLAEESGFAMESSGAWMESRALDASSWLGWAVLRAV